MQSIFERKNGLNLAFESNKMNRSYDGDDGNDGDDRNQDRDHFLKT